MARGKRTSSKLDAAELEGALGLWLRLAQQQDLKAFTQAFEGSGIGQLHYSILLLVDANPGCRQAELGAQLRIRQPNMVEPIESLIGRGLIARRPDPNDRRAQTLELTDEGRALLEQLRTAHGSIIEDYRRRLGADGYRRMIELLRRLVASA